MSELFGIWMSGPKHELCDSCRKRPAVADRELLKNLWNLRNKTSESHELSMEGISQRAGRSLQGIFCSLLTLDSRCFNPKAPNAAACTMSIVVEVGLLSGKTAALKAGLDEKVEDLKFRAQTALGIRKGWLLDSAGSVLNAIAPIKDSGVQYGDSSTLHIYRIHACRTASTLPVIHGDGSGTVWE